MKNAEIEAIQREIEKINRSLERLTEIVLGKCPHCGAPIKHVEGDYCSNCGEKLNKSSIKSN